MERYDGVNFRDPHAFLRHEFLVRDFSQEMDGRLSSIIERLTYEEALMVFHVLDTRTSSNGVITDDELVEFILMEGGYIISEKNLTLQ